MFTPKGMMAGVPARAHSSSQMCCWTLLQPVPPCSTGQFGATQPWAATILCQRTKSSRLSRL